MYVESYKIRTEAFEGPLDLLLSLIEKRKLLINDISLSEVSNDYLTYLEQHQEYPIAETAQFVLVGSTLLLIKSKSLLPVLSLTAEEQTSIEDLETRLKVLDRYKKAARSLSTIHNIHPLFTKRHMRKMEIVFSPLAGMSTASLHESMQRVLQNLPEQKPKLADATIAKVVSLEEMMVQLTERINQGLQISFRQFSHSAQGKVNIIVSFLAMLELVRQGVIRVEQETNHGDITMHADQVRVPRYG